MRIGCNTKEQDADCPHTHGSVFKKCLNLCDVDNTAAGINTC